MSAQNLPLVKRRSFASVSVDMFERWMPDAFVLAIALTAIAAAAAALFATDGSPTTILTGWYGGIFNILGFAFQMILILVSGHALAYAPPVQRGLKRLVLNIATPNQAVVVTFLIAALASWINWGFGLCDRRGAGARGRQAGARRFRLAGGRCLFRLRHL